MTLEIKVLLSDPGLIETSELTSNKYYNGMNQAFMIVSYQECGRKD